MPYALCPMRSALCALPSALCALRSPPKACPARPVAPGDGTGVGPEDRTGV